MENLTVFLQQDEIKSSPRRYDSNFWNYVLGQFLRKKKTNFHMKLNLILEDHGSIEPRN